MLHILLHFAIPLALALSLAGKAWQRAFILMALTMLVDLDHLLATPIYDPDRCSIGFHPLHQWPWFILYAALMWLPKTRWIGVGLAVHMLLDWQDCYF
ncbi:hypothetical protein GCM10009092_09650 [Bowmanella denitrificans]|uniref:Transmembrane protein n=1 Tax=Bowmanella denitrificans TaxID=366582 RepID=A0ABN0WV27_9ALTE